MTSSLIAGVNSARNGGWESFIPGALKKIEEPRTRLIDASVRPSARVWQRHGTDNIHATSTQARTF